MVDRLGSRCARATKYQQRRIRVPPRAARIAAFLTVLIAACGSGFAMQSDGCGAGECRDCHSLSRDEARGLLKDLPVEVLEVDFSDVPGLWVVDVQNRQGRRGPLYVDFSKQYVITGNVTKLATKENVTGKRIARLNPVDVSTIPLDDALVIGNPEAEHRIIVFDDPQCTFCKKLHPEMKKLAAQRDDVVFFIKLFPLTPQSREKAKSIVCAQSLQMLEDSLAGKDVPPGDCETDQVEKNIALGRSIGVRSTPTLVLPDGRVLPGYKTADQIAQLLEESAGSGRQAAGR